MKLWYFIILDENCRHAVCKHDLDFQIGSGDFGSNFASEPSLSYFTSSQESGGGKAGTSELDGVCWAPDDFNFVNIRC